MSHFWNSDHFHSPVLTDGWGKYNSTRKSHKKLPQTEVLKNMDVVS